jgi:hypothetical protein
MFKKLLVIVMVALTFTTTLITDSTPVAAHGAGQNGCTLSPDWIFHSACDTHDVCYDSPSTPNSSAGRKACDDRFLRDMRNICAWTYPTNWRYPQSYVSRSYCDAVAGTYYNAVRAFGFPYFKNTWLN